MAAAKYITRYDFNAALTVAGSPEAKAMLLASYAAGLRAMEIAALDWSMVTTASGTIGDAITLPAMATKGRTGAGTVPMSGELRQALTVIHTSRRFPRAGSVFAKAGCLTGQISANAVALLLRRLYERAGLMASSHSGRRALITDLLRSGETLPDVRRIARHASVSTTALYVCPSATMRAAIGRR